MSDDGVRVMNAFKVAVYTDGAGSYQARCLHCAWRSTWFDRDNIRGKQRRNALAVQAAKDHGNQHARGEIVNHQGERDDQS